MVTEGIGLLGLVGHVSFELAEEGEGAQCSFKARLQVLGVIREDIGTGRDYKQASTDAFKRAAVRFGVGNELYDYEQNWVEMDGDGKYAKPLEDPQAAYVRRHGKPGDQPSSTGNTVAVATPATGLMLAETESVSCPKCGGRMWDNRLTKRNPRAPDYKCQNRSCDGVIWPAKPTVVAPDGDASTEKLAAGDSSLVGIEEELPF
jgi:hypothetical protein